MRVVVDGVVFENTRQIGIWRMFYEVMRRLADRIDLTLWLRAPPVQPIPPGVTVLRDHGRWYGSWGKVASRLRAEWSRRFPNHSRIRAADVFHSTYFTRCPVRGPAVVTTVNDMIAELAYPYLGGAALAHIQAKRAAIEEAQVCVAISAATVTDLTRMIPETANKVRVIHLGHEHLLQQPSCQRTTNQDRFALFVGHRDGYKNFVTLLEAMMRSIWPTGMSLRVIGTPLGDHERALIAYYGLTERVKEDRWVTDDQLAAAYAAATCFVFPSRLEGFGLPILEAQQNGCPVVCSDIPVFREVAGNAAIFFDPRLGDRLAEAVVAACEPDTRVRLIGAGHENVRRFSWDRAADQTLAVYHEAARMARR